MKKVLFVMFAAAMAFAFTSCQKDGVYKPKERIAKVQQEWVTTTITEKDGSKTTVTKEQSPYDAQVWTWGDKTLTSIASGAVDGKIYSTATYTYDDKNRITGIKDGDEKAEFSYNDDKRLESIKIYDGAELEETFELAYDGKVVTGIKNVSYYSTKKSVLVDVIFQGPIAKCFETPKDMPQTRGVVTVTTDVTIEWDGKNIMQTVATAKYDNGSEVTTTTYEYDAKTNPFAGMYAAGDVICMSKNNVIKESSVKVSTFANISNKYENTTEYTFEYDGKFPVKCSYTKTSEDEILNTKYFYSTTYTTTYVYED